MRALSGLVGAERLEMELDIRRLEFRPGLQERRAKARRHGHRPGTFQRIFQRDADILQRVPCLAVDGARHRLVDRARLQMVLQVLADAGQLVNNLDTMS